MTASNLDTWFDELAYKRAQCSFSTTGAFILAKLVVEHDAALTVVGFSTHATGMRRPCSLRR